MNKNKSIRLNIEECSDIFYPGRLIDIAMLLRSKMDELGVGVSDIAERLNVSPANVSRWLRGNQNLSIRTLYQISDALEVPLVISFGEAGSQIVEDSYAVDVDSVCRKASTKRQWVLHKSDQSIPVDIDRYSRISADIRPVEFEPNSLRKCK